MNSPLRYPGGKAKIYDKVYKLISDNFEDKPVYVEAFAGGASLALKLLLNDVVKEIHINDLDPAIFAFWYTVKFHSEELKKRISDAIFTIGEWRRQKEIYREKGTNLVDLGFATFYLNRTNRSGVLNSNPIGGINQDGDYTMDCRFNKEKLVSFIDEIKKKITDIYIYNLDAREFLRHIDTKFDNAIIFLDPPYVKQGPNLYLNHLSKKDHEELRNSIEKLNNSWFVTYDNQELIKELYKNFKQEIYDINYSLARKRVEQEIFIYSRKLSKT